MLFPMDQIVILNIGIVVLMFLFLYSGYKQGFLIKLIGCISYLVILILSWIISPALADMIDVFPKDLTPFSGTILQPFFYHTINRMTIFFILFIGLCILTALLKPILKSLGRIPLLSQINTILGVLFGAIQAFIACFVLTIVFHTPIFANGTDVLASSFLKPFDVIGNNLMFVINDTIEQWDSLQKLIVPTDLETDDYMNIQNWMEQQGIDEKEINNFLSSLKGE